MYKYKVLKVLSQVRHLMGITKVVREMEFLELGYFFSKFFKVGIMFEMGLKIVKIGIFKQQKSLFLSFYRVSPAATVVYIRFV